MPIYEYRCEQGHTFEVIKRMSDDPVVSCETCAAPVERVFHPIAVHFKGSGFYNTDYGTRNRSRELKEAGESNGNSKDEGKSESKTDSKADSKSESKSEPASGSGSKASKSESSASPKSKSSSSD